MKALKKERRQFPRADTNLPINVIANGYDFSTSTQNVSCVGAYCHVDKYVPPFTRVMVKLALPIASNKSNGAKVECKGVIVRTEDEVRGGFNLAIFFNAIKETDRQKISRYIRQFLPDGQHTP
jgi:hypothetical protein